MEQHSLHIDYSDFFWHPVLIFIYLFTHTIGVVLFSLYLACILILIIKLLIIKTTSYNIFYHMKNCVKYICYKQHACKYCTVLTLMIITVLI